MCYLNIQIYRSAEFVSACASFLNSQTVSYLFVCCPRCVFHPVRDHAGVCGHAYFLPRAFPRPVHVSRPSNMLEVRTALSGYVPRERVRLNDL